LLGKAVFLCPCVPDSHFALVILEKQQGQSPFFTVPPLSLLCPSPDVVGSLLARSPYSPG